MNGRSVDVAHANSTAQCYLSAVFSGPGGGDHRGPCAKGRWRGSPGPLGTIEDRLSHLLFVPVLQSKARRHGRDDAYPQGVVKFLVLAAAATAIINRLGFAEVIALRLGGRISARLRHHLGERTSSAVLARGS
jgi:hypothetical protein